MWNLSIINVITKNSISSFDKGGFVLTCLFDVLLNAFYSISIRIAWYLRIGGKKEILFLALPKIEFIVLAVYMNMAFFLVLDFRFLKH